MPKYQPLPIEETLTVVFTGTNAEDCTLSVMQINPEETKVIKEIKGSSAAAIFIALYSDLKNIEVLIKEK